MVVFGAEEKCYRPRFISEHGHAMGLKESLNLFAIAYLPTLLCPTQRLFCFSRTFILFYLFIYLFFIFFFFFFFFFAVSSKFL